MSSAPRTARRRRLLLVVAVVLVVIGAAARFGLSGDIADILGGLFYAALIYVLAAFIFPRARTWALFALTLLWCLGVELWQLTAAPGDLGRWFFPFRLLFGSTFWARDLIVAAVGVVLAAVVDVVVRRRRVSRGS